MRVVAIILALAAGASGCSCTSVVYEDQCTNTCSGCVWQEQCEPDRRRNLRFGPAVPDRRKLRFGAAETGCCVPLCGPARRLTAEEMAALSAEEREERRRLC